MYISYVYANNKEITNREALRDVVRGERLAAVEAHERGHGLEQDSPVPLLLLLCACCCFVCDGFVLFMFV